jgi:hypothetical protein
VLRIGAEAVLVAAIPVIVYFVLRLSLMPLPDINDPAMHTTYIVDPRSFFERYNDLLTPTARMREGARVGFLLPARVTYLLFGPVGGFVAFRYVLALVAIGPAYVLMKRIGGIAAGITAALVVVTCPVIVTAWGTDFPDSAAVSYLIAALSCLAMAMGRNRIWWGCAASFLLTMAVWAFATSLMFAAAFAATYIALRRWREPEGLFEDLAIAAVVSVATTAVLVIGSGILLGQFDFIVPTIKSVIYLAHPNQTALWHSTSWAWAPYDAFLLVLPVVAVAWLAGARTRITTLPTTHLMVGAGFTISLIGAAVLQFFGRVQLLEEHYFSSLSWAGAMLTLSLLVVTLGSPLFEHRVWRWATPAAVLAIPLAYEWAGPMQRVPELGLVAIGAVVITLLAGAAQKLAGSWQPRTGTLALLCALDASLLLITLAPVTAHGPLPGVIASPAPRFASALRGDDSTAVDMYRVSTQLPGFVGPPAYSGQRLVMWWPEDELPQLLEPIGMFHAYFNSVGGGSFGKINAAGLDDVAQRQPALILLMSTHREADFPSCLISLAPFGPRVVRTGTLSSGSYSLHVWLIRLDRYSR